MGRVLNLKHWSSSMSSRRFRCCPDSLEGCSGGGGFDVKYVVKQWEFPKIRGTISGVPIRRTIV